MQSHKKGFTLAELLIVIAIISTLTAIAFPVFIKQREQADLQVDQTNVTSAKAVALAEYIADNKKGNQTYYYDAGTSLVFTKKDDIQGYGRTDSDDTGAQGIPKSNGNANILEVIVQDQNTIQSITWVEVGKSEDIIPTPDSDETISSNKVIQTIISSSMVWPTTNQNNLLEGNIIKGNVYSYGETTVQYYVALNNYNKGEWAHPISASYVAIELNITNPQILTEDNLVAANEWTTEKTVLKEVNTGDLFAYSNTEVYIRTTYSSWAVEPHEDLNNWIKINL